MIQRGLNDYYPNTIETWKFGEKVPEWLSDRAKVVALESDGNCILDIRKSSTNDSYSIISSAFNGELVSAKHINDYICFGDKRVFSLTEKQLNLLYK